MTRDLLNQRVTLLTKLQLIWARGWGELGGGTIVPKRRFAKEGRGVPRSTSAGHGEGRTQGD